MHLRDFHILSYFIICTTTCLSQQYPLVRYTPKDGLVSSRVRSAYQDSKGRMYFLTYSGLSVYDGTRFKNFTTQNGLRNDLVNDVIEITPDSILISTNTCGLNALVDGQLKVLPFDPYQCPTVNQFLRTPEGNLYATTDDGLYRLEPDRAVKLSSAKTGIPVPIQYLGSIMNTSRYLVMASNELHNFSGIYLFDKITNVFVDVLPKVGVTRLNQDPTGIIWILSNGSIFNLDTLSLAQGKLVMRQPYSLIIQQEDQTAGDIAFTAQNDIFLSFGSLGIIQFRKDGNRSVISSSELNGFAIQQLFVDRENTIWICNDGNGVYKLSNTNLRFDVRFTNKNTSGLYSIQPIGHDSTFVILSDGQLILHSPSVDQIISKSPPFNINLLHIHGQQVYAAERNTLYTAQLPHSGETSLHFKVILILPDSVSIGFKTMNDPFGQTFITERRNVYVYNSDKLIYTFPTNDQDLIEELLMTQDHHVWAVSRYGGIRLFSLHPDQPDQYMMLEKQFKREVENISPRCALLDDKGWLWIGTRNNGLLAYEYSTGKLTKQYQFRTQEGLTDDFVTTLAIDSNDNIIIGTQTGLDRLIKIDSGYRLENVTKSHNLFAYIKQIWINSGNQLFALTNDGNVLEVEPPSEEYITYNPELLLEEIQVNGKMFPANLSPLVLNFKQRNITFSFAAPTFVDETLVKYSYELIGHGSNHWREPTPTGDIRLVNLSPGQYTLHVKAEFPSTPYAEKKLDYSFKILPAWWQTIAFRIAVALLLIGLLFFIIRQYYRRKLENQKMDLERKRAVEKERTRIATDMHDDLGAGLSRIRFLGETIDWKNESGQSIREDINKIKTYSHEMIDKMGEIVWALNEKNDSLDDLLSYLRAYAVDYLSQHNITCHVALNETESIAFVSGEIRRNVFLTVKEALHNIVKHAHASSVELVFQIDKNLLIQIRDNGVGFNQGQIRPFSNGLTNMKRRMEEIRGTIEWNSTKGTSVELHIPLYN